MKLLFFRQDAVEFGAVRNKLLDIDRSNGQSLLLASHEKASSRIGRDKLVPEKSFEGEFQISQAANRVEQTGLEEAQFVDSSHGDDRTARIVIVQARLGLFEVDAQRLAQVSFVLGVFVNDAMNLGHHFAGLFLHKGVGFHHAGPAAVPRSAHFSLLAKLGAAKDFGERLFLVLITVDIIIFVSVIRSAHLLLRVGLLIVQLVQVLHGLFVQHQLVHALSNVHHLGLLCVGCGVRCCLLSFG
mmetsp:Transcript_60/g.108  ORF Transcript_60/g.108 Transcript_60/m.108 type:complete len:242 (-) Transcript_60:115-840(-)